MKSPFKNIGIVTRPNTPEIQDTVHTLVSFLRENGFTIYLDELSVEEHCVYIQDSAYCETVNKAQLANIATSSLCSAATAPSSPPPVK